VGTDVQYKNVMEMVRTNQEELGGVRICRFQIAKSAGTPIVAVVDIASGMKGIAGSKTKDRIQHDDIESVGERRGPWREVSSVWFAFMIQIVGHAPSMIPMPPSWTHP